MIPITLTLQGIYSYQQKQTIDFTRLLEGQIFGIFGTVGSGKSTILEAISFALYGKTERLNPNNDNRNYNMMNLKSNELQIDFTFRNYDNNIYRFFLRGKRNSKKFDDVKFDRRKAYKQENNEWIPIDSDSTEKIIGLSYENFKRTIIIPQGKFQEFLTLGDKDRTQMLKEIFNLHKFEFSQQTAAVENRNNEQLNKTEGNLERYAEITEEAIQEHQNKVQQLDEQLKAQRETLQQKEQQVKENESLKALFDDLKEKQNAFKAYQEQQTYYQDLKQKLTGYEYCRNHFKPELDKKAQYEADIKKRSQNLDAQKEKLESVNQRLEETREKFQHIEQSYQNLEHDRTRLHDFELLQKALDQETAIQQTNERITKGHHFVKQAAEEKGNHEHAINNLKTHIKTLKSRQPDWQTLTKVQSWFQTKNNLLQEKQHLENDREQTQSNYRNTQEQIDQIFPDAWKETLSADPKKDPSSVIEALESRKSSNKEKLNTRRDKLEHYRVQEKLGYYSQMLEDGQPCPLCGALEHPDILQVEDVQTHITEEQAAIKSLEKENEQIDHFLSDLQKQQQNLAHFQSQLESLQQKITEKDKALEEHNKHFLWPDYANVDETALTQKMEEANQLNEQIKQAEDQLETTENNLKKATDNHEKYRSEVEKLQNEVTRQQSERDAYINQLQVLSYNNETPEKDEIAQNIADLQQHITNTEKQYKEQQELIGQLKEQQAGLTGQIEEQTGYLTQQQEGLQQIEQNLHKALEKSGYENLDQVQSILSENLQPEQLREQISHFEQQFYKAQKDLEQVTQQTEGKTFDEAAFNQLKEEYRQLQETVQQLNDQKVETQSRLNQLKQDFETRKELLKQYEKLQHRAENIKTLKNLFSASKFVNYISSVYLQQLCEAANERFHKLTRQQLRLEITENNNFRVRDFLNNGNTRSIKTLSGGQTFQASISLALALAESVQEQNNANQNFFFMDEGFGSLDRESLQLVFDTLKSLRKENRMVGVISHVEELQQEIDVYLQVTNDEEDGSIVKRSWEG